MATADYVTAKKMTRKNPNVDTYRLPITDNGSIRIDGYGRSMAVFGDAIDKLGKYEDTGLTPEEIQELKKRVG